MIEVKTACGLEKKATDREKSLFDLQKCDIGANMSCLAALKGPEFVCSAELDEIKQTIPTWDNID